MDWVCFGGVSTVLTQALVHGVPIPPLCLRTSAPKASVVPDHLQQSPRGISGGSAQGPKWQVTCHSLHAIQKVCGCHSGSLSWLGWSGAALRREQHSQTLLPRHWTSRVAGLWEAVLVPYMRSILSMTGLTHLVVLLAGAVGRRRFSPLKKNT